MSFLLKKKIYKILFFRTKKQQQFLISNHITFIKLEEKIISKKYGIVLHISCSIVSVFAITISVV